VPRWVRKEKVDLLFRIKRFLMAEYEYNTPVNKQLKIGHAAAIKFTNQ